MKTNQTPIVSKKEAKVRPTTTHKVHKETPTKYQMLTKNSTKLMSKPIRTSVVCTNHYQRSNRVSQMISKLTFQGELFSHSDIGHTSKGFYNKMKTKTQTCDTRNKSHNSKMKNLRVSANGDSITSPLIIKKASIQLIKPKTDLKPQNDYPELPITSLMVPFLKDHFLILYFQHL